MGNLYAASSQWMNRPADERFWTLSDMRNACEAARQGSDNAVVSLASLRCEEKDGSVVLMGKTGTPASMTHYAFGQLCQTVGAPANYLRRKPADIVATTLSDDIQVAAASSEKSDRNILFWKNGSLIARAITSDRYDRVWDADICQALEVLTSEGWRVPAGRCPPGYNGPTKVATAADILPGQINISEGSTIAPSGLYASDHDMFVFLVAPDRVISDGNGGALMRGIFVSNSEVGDRALSVKFFLMQAVCGNHIVWNATGVHEINVRHIGSETFNRAFKPMQAQLKRYLDESPEEEAKIVSARNMVLGGNKSEVLNAIVKYAKTHSLQVLSRKVVEEAYTLAADHEGWYGNPRSVWGMTAGLTQLSQGSKYTDERHQLDVAAGKVLAMAF